MGVISESSKNSMVRNNSAITKQKTEYKFPNKRFMTKEQKTKTKTIFIKKKLKNSDGNDKALFKSNENIIKTKGVLINNDNKKKENKENKENKEEEVYGCLSSIFGSFFGDAIGAYCEFRKPSVQNINRIFKGNPMFGDSPGQVTDDSEMAMGSAFAIMENINLKELNSNYLYYFYGLWHISHPRDEGNTTRMALKYFAQIDYTKFNINKDHCNEIFKEIEKKNKKSLANGFLMRTSPIIVFLYFRFKSKIIEAFYKQKDNQKELYALFEIIKSEVYKDNICTHPNESLCISHSIFCIMSFGAIYGLDSTQIIANVKTLLNNKFFDGKKDYGIKEIIMKELDIYEKEKSLSSFNNAFNYFTYGDKNVTAHMGYYIHAFRLTLYYVYFFNEIQQEKEFSKFRVIMNQICSFGGDTDTNAAIVGAVIGPLIGYKNFCDEEFLKMVSLVPKNRFVFSPALMIIYVYFLKNNINNNNHKGKYFIRILLKLLYDNIDLTDIINNEKVNEEKYNKNHNAKKEDGMKNVKTKKEKADKEKENKKNYDDKQNEKVNGQNKKNQNDGKKKKKKKIQDNIFKGKSKSKSKKNK